MLATDSGAVLTEDKEGTDQESPEAAAMTMEDYLHYEEEAFKTPNHGDIVDGIVVRVDPDEVLEVNRKRNRLIVSQKAAEDEDRARKREELFSRLATGTTVKGTVSGITSYGAFVDIGGADGLIHISELSWDRVSKVTDVLQLGEEVSVKVIKLDPEQTRISLSLRQLQQDPWERLVQSMPVGSIVEGQVTKTKKYGAFLQIMPGIEGLLHISELSWDHVERTEDVLKVGETVQVKVIGIDTARRRISLSLKQLSAPPASLAGARTDRRDEYPEEEEE